MSYERTQSSSNQASTSISQEQTVADMAEGETAVIDDVGGPASSELSAMGIRAGARVEVHSKQPLNGPVVVSTGPSMTSLSRRYARHVTITTEE